MSDLATLFYSHQPPIIQRRIFEQPQPSSLVPPTRTATASLERLQTSLRHDAKRQLDRHSLHKQLSTFYYHNYLLTIFKIFLLLATSFLPNLLQHFYPSWLVQVAPTSLHFHILLLLSLTLLMRQPIQFSEEPLLQLFSKLVTPIIHCACMYEALRFLTITAGQECNHTVAIEIGAVLTFIAVFATCNWIFLNLFSPVTNRDLIRKCSKLSSRLDPLQIGRGLILSLTNRYWSIVGLFRQWCLLNLLLCVACGLSLAHLESLETMLIEMQLKHIMWAGLIFWVIDGLIYLTCFVDELIFLRQDVIVDRMHLFVSLLRLQATPSSNKVLAFSMQVHTACLKSLSRCLEHDEAFLATETVKSFVYSTYFDIFEQYANSSLRNLNCELAASRSQFHAQAFVLSCEKSLTKDPLLPFKKIFAVVSQQILTIKMIKAINESSLLFNALSKARRTVEAQSSEPAANFGHQLTSMLREIKSKCTQMQRMASQTAELAAASKQASRCIQELLSRGVWMQGAEELASR